MKLHVAAADSVYYPDVFVWCDGAQAAGQQLASDATFIAEVLQSCLNAPQPSCPA